MRLLGGEENDAVLLWAGSYRKDEKTSKEYAKKIYINQLQMSVKEKFL